MEIKLGDQIGLIKRGKVAAVGTIKSFSQGCDGTWMISIAWVAALGRTFAVNGERGVTTWTHTETGPELKGNLDSGYYRLASEALTLSGGFVSMINYTPDQN